MSLTRGSSIGISSMLDYLNPTRGSYAAVVSKIDGKPPLIGQMHFTLGERAAHLSFLLPINSTESKALPKLLDGLAKKAGKMGAFSLIAELDEDSPIFESVRRSGFGVYGWQQIWQFPIIEETDQECAACWRSMRPEDEFAIRNLYQSLVPPLVQGAEAFAAHQLQGLVFCQNGKLLAFIEGISGPKGIYLIPLIHPEVDNVVSLLKSLPGQLGPLLGRPVYIAIRSYQGWLASHMADFGASSMPRQALMVKHLAVAQRSAVPNAHRTVIEAKAKPAAPIVHNIYNDSTR